MDRIIEVVVEPNYDRKVWFATPTTFKTKYVIDGTTYIINYDISGIMPDVNYRYPNSDANNVFDFAQRLTTDQELRINRYAYLTGAQTQFVRMSPPASDSDYPFYFYVADGETETDEPADRYYQFPPAETIEERKARIQPRLTQIANRLVIGLPHNLVHFSAKSSDMCNDVGNHENVDRYDYAVNSIKLFVGYIQRELDGDDPDFDVIEPLVDELEQVTPDTIEAMPILFNKLNFNAWADATRDKCVHAGMNLETGEPNRLIYNINEQPHNRISDDSPLGAGDVDHAKALVEFHEISAICFDSALQAPQTEVITEKTVAPLEYTPDFRNANLATLTLIAPGVGRINLFDRITPDFDPDVIEYTITDGTIQAGDANRTIEATPEVGIATLTGAGLLSDLFADPIPTGEKIISITITSQDGIATKTYRFTFTVS